MTAHFAFFSVHNKYTFYRFINTTADVQKQALLWLQKLCLLEIPIPLDVLFDMLNCGLDALVITKRVGN
jgi:hypothetical protein